MKRPSPSTNRLIFAWTWAVFGVIGLVQYGYIIATTPGMLEKVLKTPIAASIPVLFAASIYANFTTDLDRAEGKKREEQEKNQGDKKDEPTQ